MIDVVFFLVVDQDFATAIPFGERISGYMLLVFVVVTFAVACGRLREEDWTRCSAGDLYMALLEFYSDKPL